MKASSLKVPTLASDSVILNEKKKQLTDENLGRLSRIKQKMGKQIVA